MFVLRVMMEREISAVASVSTNIKLSKNVEESITFTHGLLVNDSSSLSVVHISSLSL